MCMEKHYMWENSNSPTRLRYCCNILPINKRDTEMTLMMTRPDSSTTCMENNTSSCDNMRWKTSKIYIFHSVRLFINRGVWSYNIWPNEMKKVRDKTLGILVIVITRVWFYRTRLGWFPFLFLISVLYGR